MQHGQPSRTAYAAARYRAVHQVLDGGRVFADPLAVPILGADPATLREDEPERRVMRLFIAARSRYAEDALAGAVRSGTRQVVVLGAGLDTFAHRHPYGPLGLRVFEVDHPATQAWKRERLAQAGLRPPDSLTFAPVDFERGTLADGLREAGFDATRPAFVTWLGVVPYLTTAAVFATLRYIAGLPAGTAVVFDYADPPELLTPEQRARREAGASRVAVAGEPWRCYFTAPELAAGLREIGLTEIEDLGPADLAQRYLGIRSGTTAGGHIIRAATATRSRPPSFAS